MISSASDIKKESASRKQATMHIKRFNEKRLFEINKKKRKSKRNFKRKNEENYPAKMQDVHI